MFVGLRLWLQNEAEQRLRSCVAVSAKLRELLGRSLRPFCIVTSERIFRKVFPSENWQFFIYPCRISGVHLFETFGEYLLRWFASTDVKRSQNDSSDMKLSSASALFNRQVCMYTIIYVCTNIYIYILYRYRYYIFMCVFVYAHIVNAYALYTDKVLARGCWNRPHQTAYQS